MYSSLTLNQFFTHLRAVRLLWKDVTWRELQPSQRSNAPKYGSLWHRLPQGALLVANKSSSCLTRVQLITECSEIIIYNWVFCFSEPQERGACWVKYGRSTDSSWAVRSLSPHSDSDWMELDESLIGLGKHPHGGCLLTKEVILFSLVEANVLRSRLVSGCPVLPRILKPDEIDGTPRVISTPISVCTEFQASCVVFPILFLFPRPAKYIIFTASERTKKTKNRWDMRFAAALH